MVTFPTKVSGNTSSLLVTSKSGNIIYVDQDKPFALICAYSMTKFKVYQTFSINFLTDQLLSIFLFLLKFRLKSYLTNTFTKSQ